MMQVHTSIINTEKELIVFKDYIKFYITVVHFVQHDQHLWDRILYKTVYKTTTVN